MLLDQKVLLHQLADLHQKVVERIVSVKLHTMEVKPRQRDVVDIAHPAIEQVQLMP